MKSLISIIKNFFFGIATIVLALASFAICVTVFEKLKPYSEYAVFAVLFLGVLFFTHALGHEVSLWASGDDSNKGS